MRKYILTLILLFIGTLSYGGLFPDTYNLSWKRSDMNSTFTTNILMTGGVTYVLSNTVYDASGSVQDLTNVGSIFKVGNFSTNLAFNGTTINAASGTIVVYITIPTTTPKSIQYDSTSIQLTLTNGSYSVTYNGQKQAQIRNPL